MYLSKSDILHAAIVVIILVASAVAVPLIALGQSRQLPRAHFHSIHQLAYLTRQRSHS
ncbi:MAG: hypothetical protein NVS2B14_04630 [Chamaesiphon sp.]